MKLVMRETTAMIPFGREVVINQQQLANIKLLAENNDAILGKVVGKIKSASYEIEVYGENESEVELILFAHQGGNGQIPATYINAIIEQNVEGYNEAINIFREDNDASKLAGCIFTEYCYDL